MTVAVIIVLLLLFAGIYVYNDIISRKNAVDNAYYSMDVMLKKRYDLIPNLVATVKGYMQYEKETLAKVTELRQQVINEDFPVNQRVHLDNQIQELLQQIAIRFENYPELKANQNFLHLQGALNETEEQLAASRRFYNSAVKEYHQGIEMFPYSLFASQMGLKRKDYFNIPDNEKVNPSSSIN